MKKKLLIAWSSPYLFHEIIMPLIPHFAEHFQTFVLLRGDPSNTALVRDLRRFVTEGIIEDFFLAPSKEERVRFHFFMKSIIPHLRRHRFDLALFLSVTEFFERYIVDCALPARCIRVCLQHGITYLLINEPIARALLAGVEKNQAVLQKSGVRGSPIGLREKCYKFIPLRLLPGKLRRKIYALLGRIRKRWRFYCDRYCIPRILIGKTFPLHTDDALTQIGSDATVDAVIFCDEIEAQAHQKLFARARVYVAQYPARRTCRCGMNRGCRQAILSPLSGFVGQDDIAEKCKQLYARDFRSVMKETGVQGVHLRLHPRETGRWPYQLQDYLQEEGIDTKIVGSARPLRDVVCEYAGVVGFASCALRDARAFCDFGFVVGFIAISRSRYSDPRFVYGKGEGIGWIEDDGTYHPDIFVRRRYTAPQRKDMIEIVTEIAFNKDDMYGKSITRAI